MLNKIKGGNMEKRKGKVLIECEIWEDEDTLTIIFPAPTEGDLVEVIVKNTNLTMP